MGKPGVIRFDVVQAAGLPHKVLPFRLFFIADASDVTGASFSRPGHIILRALEPQAAAAWILQRGREQ